MKRAATKFFLLCMAACAAPPTGEKEESLSDPTDETLDEQDDDAGNGDDDPANREDDDGGDNPPEDDEDEVPENDPDDYYPPDGEAPVEGYWTTVTEAMALDDCNMADWVTDGPGGSLVIDVTSDGAFEMSDRYGNVDCNYADLDFDCSSRRIEDDTPSIEYGLDALIVLDLTSFGSFDGYDYLSMQTNISTQCAGADCWLVEIATASFPCEMQLLIEAEAEVEAD